MSRLAHYSKKIRHGCTRTSFNFLYCQHRKQRPVGQLALTDIHLKTPLFYLVSKMQKNICIRHPLYVFHNTNNSIYCFANLAIIYRITNVVGIVVSLSYLFQGSITLLLTRVLRNSAAISSASRPSSHISLSSSANGLANSMTEFLFSELMFVFMIFCYCNKYK